MPKKYITIVDPNDGSEATFKLEDISLVSIPSQFAVPFGKANVVNPLGIIQIYGQIIQMKVENAQKIKAAMLELEMKQFISED